MLRANFCAFLRAEVCVRCQSVASFKLKHNFQLGTTCVINSSPVAAYPT